MTRSNASIEKHVKILFELEPADWHNHGAETIWADALGEGCYRLLNSPFAAYGVSFGDIVRAEEVEGRLTYTSTHEASGHSTYRAILAPETRVGTSDFLEAWSSLQALGCTYESDGKSLLAIDVPAGVDVREAYNLLVKGEELGVWGFEEAHFGHKVGATPCPTDS
jgi:hypothetical protein